MATTDHTEPKGAFATAFWAVLLFLAAPLIALIFFKGVGQINDDLEAKRAAGRKEKLAELREANRMKLHETAWVDKAKGIVQLPIDEAMKLTLVELQNKVPKPSNVKPQPVPPPAATPAPSQSAASPSPGPATAGVPLKS